MAAWPFKPWDYVVKVGDVLEDEDAPFAQRRDEIVRRIRQSGATKDPRNGEELSGLVDELAECPDPEAYADVIDDIYDLADENKFMWLGP